MPHTKTLQAASAAIDSAMEPIRAVRQKIAKWPETIQWLKHQTSKDAGVGENTAWSNVIRRLHKEGMSLPNAILVMVNWREELKLERFFNDGKTQSGR